MRIRILAVSAVVAMALQGCVGTGAIMNPAQQQGLQSLQLFGADASPRFTFYLACTSDSVNCITVENAFSDWAADRHVSLHAVEPDDGAFQAGRSSRPSDQAVPYRVTVHYLPWITPGYNNTSLSGGGGSYAAVIGYSATISVFDSATGKLLQTVPVRAERTADDKNVDKKAGANPYIRSAVRSFLVGLDPAYAHQ